MSRTTALLDQQLSRLANSTSSGGIALTIEPNARTEWAYSREADKPFLVASVSKTIYAAIAMMLVDEGRLSLDAPAMNYLGTETMEGMCRIRGEDLSPSVLVSDLLAHTSGVPDYYRHKRILPFGDVSTSTAKDPGWTREEALGIARAMPGKFPPHSGRSAYSFTNYQLLGAVLETVSGRSLGQLLEERICKPLGLQNTDLLTPTNLSLFDKCLPVTFGKKPYKGARRMASLGAEGAVVSTSNELVAIFKALVHGNLISRDSFENMSRMRGQIWPGVSYGLGLMSLSVRNSWNPTATPSEMLGHLGATGSFMLWLPRHDVFLAGHSGQLLGQKATQKMLRAALSFVVSQ